MNYLVGDIQGCDGALARLLDTVGFSPSRDRLHALGDLVNRGPASLAVLRRLRDLGDAAPCVLGNHDWHLLAVVAGVRPKHRHDTLDDILDAPDRDAWIEWLRWRPMALHAHGVLMVHAGVVPGWTTLQTLELAHELEQALRHEPLAPFLATMFGNEPSRWSDALDGADRLRFVLNTLTRVRFVATDGTLEFATKDGAGAAPPGHHPWFDAPGRRTADTTVAFGHWSTLGYLERPNLIGLDTGCAWGGELTAVRLGADGSRERISVPCGPASP